MEPVPGLKIDSTTLGWGGTMLLLLLNLFKAQIAAILSNSLPAGFLKLWEHWSTRRADREEFSQVMEEVQLNSKLQAEATKQLREAHHEDVLADMVANKDEWIQETLTNEIRALRASNGVLIEKVTANTAALTAMNGNLVQLVDLIQKLPTPPGWLRR